MQDNQSAMGKAFDEAKNDDTFYLPPEVFDNPDFKRGMKMFLSPDGKAVRFIITHEGDPDVAGGHLPHRPDQQRRVGGHQGHPAGGLEIYLAGTASSFKDMQDSANYDLMIAVIAALSLIFIIMLILTRSVVAAVVIVGTVVLSLGASFGLSVLIWQHLLGIQLHWMVLAMAVIILLAVGSDYNLLLVSRFKEEIRAGLNTGIIRAMAGTGSVVTSAGLVFAFTMGGDGVRRADGAGPDRHHHRHRPAVRHPGDALVHDAVDRRAAGPLVLVAAAGASASGAQPVAAAGDGLDRTRRSRRQS